MQILDFLTCRVCLVQQRESGGEEKILIRYVFSSEERRKTERKNFNF
jgi:hypothetical protein